MVENLFMFAFAAGYLTLLWVLLKGLFINDPNDNDSGRGR